MPFHELHLTRRELFKVATAAGTGILTIRLESPADSACWALISDTHIGASREMVARETNMAANLEKVAGEITGFSRRPVGILLNGDCAYKEGLAADYALFRELVQLFHTARIPLHMTLGNHDHRDRFRTEFKSGKKPLLQSKHVTVIETGHVNWFLLDSLDQTNVTPGRLGAEQLAWLEKALDARSNKPAIVLGHHNPEETPASGLLDWDALLRIVVPRRQVKAYVFGHTHHWSMTEREGIHLINLPPVAYVFQKGDPNGWVEMDVRSRGAALHFHSLDRSHAAHGQTHELTWRT